MSVFTVCLQITVTLIASVHYLLPVYREVSRFEDGVHVIFTFNKNICVANISHLSKVCDDTIPNLITMKQVELLTLQSYRGFVAIFSPTISGQSMWDAWCVDRFFLRVLPFFFSWQHYPWNVQHWNPIICHWRYIKRLAASKTSLKLGTSRGDIHKSHIFIHQIKRTVAATLLTAWEKAASAFC